MIGAASIYGSQATWLDRNRGHRWWRRASPQALSLPARDQSRSDRSVLSNPFTCGVGGELHEGRNTMSKTNTIASEANIIEEDLPAARSVAVHPRADRNQHLRIIEATLFAAEEPLATAQLAALLPEGAEIDALLADLQHNYANRGVNVVQVAGKWALRTADDLSFLLRREVVEQKRLSKAALETLAIVAYHQPATRAEIEEI